MSRPTRNEVEKAIEWADPKTDYQYKVVQAARAWAGLAPDTCPTRNGKGSYVVQSSRGYLETDTLTCADCGGRGVVWPDELAERIAAAVEPFMVHPLETAGAAMAVLDVLWVEADDATL